MTDPRHSPLNTGEIRAWWETCARSVNTPTPHWTIPVLCDEVDRLRAEMDHLRRVVRAADQMAAENESAARRVTGEAGEARGGVHVEVTRLRAENDRLTAENRRLMEAARL